MEHSLQQYDSNRRAQIWAERISECRSSGLTVKDWCERAGLSCKTYYYWQHKLYQVMSQRSSFVEISGSRYVPSAEITARLRIDNIECDIISGADEVTIAALIRAIKSC